MKHPNSGRKGRGALVLIILFALALRIGLFLAVQPWKSNILENKILIGDASGYYHLAGKLYLSGIYNSAISQFRTPGYPFFIASIYRLVGIRPWVVLLIQIFLNIITLVLLYRFAHVFFGSKIALIVSMLFAIDPLHVFYSNTLLTETLFSFLFLISAFGFYIGLFKESLTCIIAASIVLGLTTLIRPVTQFFPLIVLGAIVLWHQSDRSFRIKAAVVFSVLYAATVLPWAVRNYIKYNHFSLTSFTGYNLLIDNATAAAKAKTGKSYAQLRGEFWKQAMARGATDGTPTFNNSKIFGEVAKEYLMDNLSVYAPLHLKGMLLVFLDVGVIGICRYLDMDTQSLTVEFTATKKNLLQMVTTFFRIKPAKEILFSVPIYALQFLIYGSSLYGIFLMLKEREFYLLFYFIVIVVYFSFLPGVIGQARYRVPIIPFYSIIAAKGMCAIACHLTHGGRSFRLFS